jgi:hypothetical protein
VHQKAPLQAGSEPFARIIKAKSWAYSDTGWRTQHSEAVTREAGTIARGEAGQRVRGKRHTVHTGRSILVVVQLLDATLCLDVLLLSHDANGQGGEGRSIVVRGQNSELAQFGRGGRDSRA